MAGRLDVGVPSTRIPMESKSRNRGELERATERGHRIKLSSTHDSRCPRNETQM